MNAKNAVVIDMRQLLAFLRPMPPVLDDNTADRLLAGRLDPADAPPGYARVARLLAAATAPATPDELAGELAAVAEFAAVVRSTPPTPVPRRASMPSKLLSLKAAGAALVAVLSIGGIAAATGLLPAQLVAGQAPATARSGAAAHAQRDAALATVDSTRAGAAALGGQRHATGPDATGAAKDGLCRAYLAGQGGVNGKRADSPAFQALAAAAGGADKVAAYCQDTTLGGSATHRQGQGGPPSTIPAAGQGGPPSTSPGHGGPTTTMG